MEEWMLETGYLMLDAGCWILEGWKNGRMEDWKIGRLDGKEAGSYPGLVRGACTG